MEAGIPNCLKCANYFISYDPGKPYGCKAMAFKCRISPARVVYESSGIACQLFAPKKTAHPSGSKKTA